MKKIFSRLTLLFVFVLVITFGSNVPSVSAVTGGNVYISQSGVGTQDGSSCANAKPVSFFNTSANWGTSASQIGPGSVVHLCGIITTSLSVNGSGSSGSPITIVFETGAKISVPACGTSGCINVASKSYITIDGSPTGTPCGYVNGVDVSCNGMIEATNSGTGKGNAESFGIYARSGASNIEIRNLTISNMYVHIGTGNDSAPNTYYGLWFDGNNNNFHNLIIHDTAGGIVGEAPNSGNNFYNNQLYNNNWAVFLSGGSPNSITNNTIHDNDIHDWANWDTTSDAYHHDGIFISGNSSTADVANISIYNNYIHGHSSDPIVCASASDSCMTAFIYVNTDNHVRVFNNLLVANPGDYVNNAWILMYIDDSDEVYNNTIIGGTNNGTGGCLFFENATNATSKNNILSNCGSNMWINGATFKAIDNNVYQDTIISGTWRNGGNFYNSLAAWQSAIGGDANAKATTASLNLDSNYHPISGSVAVGAGANLTSLGLASLNLDKAGVSRPTTGAWDAGAFQLNGSTTTPIPPITPTPPTIPTPDTIAPSIPSSLSASAVSSSQINLSWAASTDNTGVTGYKIFRGGVQIGTSASNTYANTGLAAGTSYSYTVSSYDAAGNNSTQSNSASSTTQAPVDTTAPSAPVGLSANAISTSQVNLTWTASTDNIGVTGYKIFRGGTQIGTSASGSYSNTGLVAGTLYSYTVSAYDAAGNNSSQSSPSSATTLTPAPTTTPVTIPTPPINSNGCLTGSTTWQNTSISIQSSPFIVSYDVTPSANNIDGVTGLSSGSVTAYTSMSAIVRFHNSGMIDVMNGSAYSSLVSVPYTAGQIYHVRLVVNPQIQVYSVYVTTPGGAETQIANNYSFRTTAPTTSINNWSVYSEIGSHVVCNFNITSLTPTPTPTPVPPSTFVIGSRVKTTSSINVRPKPSNRYGNRSTCVQPTGTLGTISAGPTVNNNHTWWNVSYDTSCSGWSVQDYLSLVTVANATISHTLSVGSSGDEVTALQTILSKLGVYHDDITGYFGSITKAAVMNLQSANNVAAVGVVGPKTRALLQEILTR